MQGSVQITAGLTVSYGSGNLTVSTGNLTVPTGNLTVSTSALTANAGATITGNVSMPGYTFASGLASTTGSKIPGTGKVACSVARTSG